MLEGPSTAHGIRISVGSHVLSYHRQGLTEKWSIGVLAIRPPFITHCCASTMAILHAVHTGSKKPEAMLLRLNLYLGPPVSGHQSSAEPNQPKTRLRPQTAEGVPAPGTLPVPAALSALQSNTRIRWCMPGIHSHSTVLQTAELVHGVSQ